MLLFFFSATHFYAQTAKAKITTLVCDCFENAPKTGKIQLDLLKTCYDFSNSKYQELFKEVAKEEVNRLGIDTLNTDADNYQNGYELGYELGKRMFNEIQEPLVRNCDTYFYFMEETKKEMISNLDKGITKKRVDSLKRVFKKENWDPNVQWEIGAYYLLKGKTKKAEKSLKKCLSKDPEHIPSIFFLAIIDDMHENYESAINGFDRVDDDLTNPLSFVATIFLEASKRKKRENRS